MNADGEGYQNGRFSTERLPMLTTRCRNARMMKTTAKEKKNHPDTNIPAVLARATPVT
jgi:hypothetical protein